MGETSVCFSLWTSTDRLPSVSTDVHVFRGVPHAFRRFGDKLSASKYWDRVMNDGISWALTNPTAGPFEIKSD